MRRFIIVPFESDADPIELASLDETTLYAALARYGCQEAAVFEGEAYRFSLKLDDTGEWHTFRREMPAPTRPI